MKKLFRLVCLLACLALLCAPFTASVPVQAGLADAWWDAAWPYRLPVTVSGSGVARAAVNFTAAFQTLGLNGALLDVRSLRVVPYQGGTPGAPLPYMETYTALLEDADHQRPGVRGWIAPLLTAGPACARPLKR